MGGIGPDSNWWRALDDVDVVIHLAARTHVMRDTAAVHILPWWTRAMA